MYTSTRSPAMTVAVAAVMTLMVALPTFGAVVELSFAEVAARADLIFHGTVVDQECYYGKDSRMIFTDVTFAIEKVVLHRPEAKALVGDTVVLTSAGGRIGDYMVGVSDVPRFVTGEQYLVLTRYDGVQYATPIVGASQGVFPITVDDATGIAYPLTTDRRTLTSIDDGSLTYGPRTERIFNGAQVKAADVMPDLRFEVTPRPVGISAEQGASAVAGAVVSAKHGPRSQPMTLDELIGQIHRRLVDEPDAAR